jgi:DNA-directed RNA polymerase beta subunit
MKISVRFRDLINRNKGIIGLIFIVLLIVFFVYAIVIFWNPSTETATGINLFFTPLVTVIGFVLVLINLKGIQETNKVILSQPVYNELKEEIAYLKEDSEKKILSVSEVNEIKRVLGANFMTLTYHKFLVPFYIVFKKLSKNSEYQYLLKCIKENKSKISDDNLDRIEDYLEKISELFSLQYSISDFYNQVYYKYKEIFYCKFLIKEQKEQLFQSLDEICSDYFNISESLVMR